VKTLDAIMQTWFDSDQDIIDTAKDQ